MNVYTDAAFTIRLSNADSAGAANLRYQLTRARARVRGVKATYIW